MMTEAETPVRNGRTSPNGRGRTVRQAKPILTGLEWVAGLYEFSNHATEQMQTRGVGVMEVLSAIKAPDTVRPEMGEDNNKWIERGDLRVVVDPFRHVVITVIDLDADHRETPRVPLTTADIPAPIPTPAPEPVAPVPPRKAQAPSKSKGRATQPNLPVEERRMNLSSAERNDIEWMLGDHEIEDIRFMTITPAIATTLLDHNTNNRKRSQADTTDWAGEMDSGNWLTTHQGIAFDRNKVLLDGQHRLTAVVESGAQVRMPVAVGLDPKVFAVIDAGRPRRAADALYMIGEKDTLVLSAAARLAYMYENGLLEAGRFRMKVHNDAQVAYVRDHSEELHKAITWATHNEKTGFKMTRGAAVVGHMLLYRKCGKDNELVNTFLHGVGTGLNLATADDPRNALRRVILNDVRRDRFFHLALFIKAWNAYANGRKVSILVWKTGERYPAIFVPPPDRPLFQSPHLDDEDD